jgi:hypothetical protein
MMTEVRKRSMLRKEKNILKAVKIGIYFKK